MLTSTPLTIAVAGATGFVGRHLCGLLRDRGHRVLGLGRSVPDGVQQDGLTWRRADLYRLRQTERALQGADVVVYLVHSMLPGTRLQQGRFEDLDLLLADNVGRAAAAVGARRIVYLGGLLPPAGGSSRHLDSRREVEAALTAHGVPVTTLRAGLVIGPHGSSFRILERLVTRLPVLVMPRWTQERTQPIALDDVLELIARVAESGAFQGAAIDVGGPEVLSYGALIARTAQALGLRRRQVAVPVGSPFLSELWVTAVTGVPRQLTGPLIESLEHSMVARDRAAQQSLGVDGLGVEEALRRALSGQVAAPDVVPPRGTADGVGWDSVRSVQRMRLPAGWTAAQAAHAYLEWLPRGLFPLLRVRPAAAGGAAITLRGVGLPLLVLRQDPLRSTPDRAVLTVVGGLLARLRDPPRARLELRQVLDGRTLVAAVHDFEPRLPWAVYRVTQAQVHVVVMYAFASWLARQRPREAAGASWTPT